MEIIKITPLAGKLWDEAWGLYTESFPEHERRRISSHNLALKDPEFYTHIAVEQGHLLALLFYWQHGDTIYLEHIAVNPPMRGQSIGTSVLRNFLEQNTGCTVILEIDPPVDDVSVKRLRFYEKLGFKTNGYPFIHPSYRKRGMEHPLVILSYPAALSPDEFACFTDYIHTTVLRYID